MESKFISPDKNYILEFSKSKSLNLFTTNFEYICKITFKNNLNITLSEIITNELEIYKLIDCLDEFIYLENDLVYYFNSNTRDYTNKVITIKLESYIGNYDSSNLCNLEPVYSINLYNFDNETLTHILSFNISQNNIIELSDKLYEFFIKDTNLLLKNNNLQQS